MKLFIIAVLFVALNAYGSPELLEAAERGDVVEVKRLIDAGADVNFQDNKGETALISTVRSVIRGKSDVAQTLIDAGADVNIQSYNGSTALQIAVLFEHRDVVGVLIDAGANLDIQNDYGDTALTYAAQIGDSDTAQTLIDAGADVGNRIVLLRDTPAAPPFMLLAHYKCVQVTETGVEEILVLALKSSAEPTFFCYRRIKNTFLLAETAIPGADVTDLLLED